ncbi:methionine gamma-lyase [Glaciecola sp. XM2]|jgi:methionine-gamma-lyase|uniref:methionine gamma-lyase n=1 Tax=Glaciecola sp. XM2 TaxID=1914931 RepID=UPI001BDF22AC|nr:methionine gamma-lyase [Glaciecola sp. XM2]MBT1450367.1 methionine gamma-lyase [Glaciecola sp. XM2]
MEKNNRTYDGLGFATQAIHYAYAAKDEQGALNPPMHLSSTFTFENAQHGSEMFAGERPGHFYSRISNPTLDILEKRIACLEQAEAALSTASGMGAISATLWTLLQAGDEVLVDETLYGCTYAFMHHGLAKFGVTIKHVDMTDIEAVKKGFNARTKVMYFETPANPNMRLIDIEAVCALAKAAKVISVVDNTYATPLITQPICLGADLVIHSATKYLGGHGDLVAGLVVGGHELIQRIRLEGLKDMTGACMSPFTAMLIMRGLKTLEIRMQRHSQSAYTIARFLEQRSEVKWVSYPGLESHPQQRLANKQMRYFGGMIAFELHGGSAEGIAFMDALNLVQRAVSLGDAETLIQHPASMTHSAYTEEERAHHGISESLLRLSVGLECEADITEDLLQAFDAIKGSRVA